MCGSISAKTATFNDQTNRLISVLSHGSRKQSESILLRRPRSIRDLKFVGQEAMRGGGHGGHGHGGGHGHDSEHYCDEATLREAMQRRSERIAKTERVVTFLKLATTVGGLGSFFWFLSL